MHMNRGILNTDMDFLHIIQPIQSHRMLKMPTMKMIQKNIHRSWEVILPIIPTRIHPDTTPTPHLNEIKKNVGIYKNMRDDFVNDRLSFIYVYFQHTRYLLMLSPYDIAT